MLINFGASWCGPCRGENPNIVKAYSTYKENSFNVVSISLDNDKVKWKEAIKEDGFTWTYLSDLKGWKNEAAKFYAVG